MCAILAVKYVRLDLHSRTNSFDKWYATLFRRYPCCNRSVDSNWHARHPFFSSDATLTLKSSPGYVVKNALEVRKDGGRLTSLEGITDVRLMMLQQLCFFSVCFFY